MPAPALPRKLSIAKTGNRPPRRLLRLLDILFLARTDETWTAPRLSKRLKVSRRQIYNDIAILNQAGCRILGYPGGYRLSNPGLQMPITLRPSEILALLEPGRGADEERKTAREKLTEALPKPYRDLYRKLGHVAARPAISAAPERIHRKLEHAIANLQRVKITYRSHSDDDGRDRDVEPYGTYVKGTGWYLAGLCVRTGIIKTYRADRIANVVETGANFQRRPDFDLAQFTASPGVWTAAALDALIEVRRSHVAVLKSEAGAMAWIFEPRGRGGLLRIARGNLHETAWILARFGEGIKVLAPAALRDRLIRVARAILALNERVQG
jgi:predicted DNA-binding transcriptional regulator YafY